MKVLLLVNSSASSVTARSRVVIQKALSADHDVTLAETSRRGHATRLAQGAAAAGTEVVVVLGGRRHAQRGGQRPGRHRRAPWPPCRAARRTCSPARSACPTTPSRPPASCSTRSPRRQHPPRRPRVGERPLLPLPRRHGVRRRGRRPGRAARRRSSATPGTRCSCTPGSTRGSATTTAAGPASRCASPTAASWTTGTCRICLNTNPYTYLGQPAPRPGA